jgi:hypothetical protein
MRGLMQIFGADTRGMSIVVTILSIAVGLIAAFIGMRRWPVFAPTDWKHVPKGEYIQKQLKK